MEQKKAARVVLEPPLSRCYFSELCVGASHESYNKSARWERPVNQRTRIYLDYAATTPLRSESSDAMRDAESAGFNPSSPHAEGRRARALLDDARERVAAVLGASRKEIEFTGSGTEADNHALYGVLRARGSRGHIVTTAIEHHAVLRTVEDLAERGCDVTVLPVDGAGRVDPAEFAGALRSDTSIASVMYANNEIGTVAPIAELAALAHERGVLFHTDAVQAPGWLPLDVARARGRLALALAPTSSTGPRASACCSFAAARRCRRWSTAAARSSGRRSGHRERRRHRGT